MPAPVVDSIGCQPSVGSVLVLWVDLGYFCLGFVGCWDYFIIIFFFLLVSLLGGLGFCLLLMGSW